MLMQPQLPLMFWIKWLTTAVLTGFILFSVVLIIVLGITGFQHPWPYPLH